MREQQRRRRHDGQRRLVPRTVRQVRLLRDPGPASETADRLVRGRNRLGANRSAGCRAHAGVLPAHVQPPTRSRCPPLLGQPHERIVHGRSAGTAAHRPDRRRQRDVVVGLPAQRDPRSATRRSRWHPSWRRSARRTPSRSSAPTSRSSWASRDRAFSGSAAGYGAARHSGPARSRQDVPRMRRAAASLHEGEGRRRARAAGQRQRRLRHRCQLAPAGCRPVTRRTSGRGRPGRRRASAPVHAVPRGQRVRLGTARRSRSRSALPRIRRGGRAFRHGARRTRACGCRRSRSTN